MQWFKNNLIVIVVVIAVLCFIFIGKEKEANPEEFQSFSAEETIESKVPKQDTNSETMFVDVKGEVNKPGIIKISGNERVDDIIELAGGFTSKANTTSVNLAQKVHDEMVILVPKSGEISATPVVGETPDDQEKVKVRINSASKEEIEQLSGIGSKKAEAIMEYRDTNGYFQKPEDLLEITGIGKKTLEKITEEIQIP